MKMMYALRKNVQYVPYGSGHISFSHANFATNPGEKNGPGKNVKGGLGSASYVGSNDV